MRIWRTHWVDEYWAWIVGRLTVFWAAVRYDVDVDNVLLPWVIEPAKEHLIVQMDHCGDQAFIDERRRALLAEYKLGANDLPPDVHIERLHYDEHVQGTGREYLEGWTVWWISIRE